MPESCDHTGAPLKHWRVRVNGIRMRQAVGGQVEPILLVHGTGRDACAPSYNQR
jgi:hypothetical protein